MMQVQQIQQASINMSSYETKNLQQYENTEWYTTKEIYTKELHDKYDRLLELANDKKMDKLVNSQYERN